MALSENIGVISYSPLGGGLLTGKYGIKKRPKAGRLIENKMYKKRYGDPQVFKIAEKFSHLAKEQDLSPISLAVAWVASHPAVTAPIIGGRNSKQLKESLKSVDIKMTKKLRNIISALSPEPPIATDRNEEQTIYNYGQR
jgi:aryl-alcohol dehydrogenase-like predicted oxidoreductase